MIIIEPFMDSKSFIPQTLLNEETETFEDLIMDVLLDFQKVKIQLLSNNLEIYEIFMKNKISFS